MRCVECGHMNAANLLACRICYAPLLSSSQARVSSISHATETIRNNSAQLAGIMAQSQIVVDNRSRVQPILNADPVTPMQQSRGDVVGRVIAVDGPFLERPDMDVCRIITRLLWLLLFVVSPIVVLRVVLETLGGLSALLALVGIVFLLRFLSPTNLFAMFHLAVLLNPFGRREVEQVPVRYLRVRGTNGDSEHIVRIKGALAMGNVMQDDLVSCWGRFRGGVLHARQAFSHRTQSWVELERAQSWFTLALTVTAFGLIVAYFYGPIAVLWQRLSSFDAGHGFLQ